MRRLVISAFVLWCAHAASAETLTILENTYSPLMDTKNGQIMSCGIHYSAFMTRYDGSPLGVQGSFSLLGFGATDLIMASKATAVTAKNEDLVRMPIHNLALRGNKGGYDAMQQERGEDGYSQMLFTGFMNNPDLSAQLVVDVSQGMWVSLNLDPNTNDVSFKLPGMNDGQDFKVYQDFLECQKDLLQDTMRQIEKLAE